MAKFKPYNPDQVTMLPISLQNQIVPGSLEHTINELVENHIDLSLFDRRYKNDATGAYAINPKILLKIILLAYSRGLISSRQMERACRENATFMALCSGYFPDHSTIASFVSSMQNEIENVFCNVLLVCDELGLLGGTHFSLDGVKLSANVSKEWSGTFDELKHKRDKLQQKLEQVLAEHIQTDQQPELELEHQKKRERRLQLQVERLNQFIENEKPKIGNEGKEIQSNAIDNQSVKMPTSHGVLQGYNAQALVDSKHQVILAAETFSSQDHENLEPMIKGGKKTPSPSEKVRPSFRKNNSALIATITLLSLFLSAKTKTSMLISPISSSANGTNAFRTSSASTTAATRPNHNHPGRTASLPLTSPLILPTRFTFAPMGSGSPAMPAIKQTAIAPTIFTTLVRKIVLSAP